MFSFLKKPLLPENELLQIKQAVHAAEEKTSGEIRVYVEKSTHGYDVLERAANRFVHLKMDKTAERNGVLIYLAFSDKQFAVAGDTGIHQHVAEDFWETVKHEMIPFLKEKQFADGICKAVEMTGTELAKHYPHRANDKNELSDDVVMG